MELNDIIITSKNSKSPPGPSLTIINNGTLLGTTSSNTSTISSSSSVSALENFLQKNSSSSLSTRTNSSSTTDGFRLIQNHNTTTSSQTTRIRQSQFQNLRLSSSNSIKQGGFPIIMELNNSDSNNSLFSNSENLVELMRKKMESMGSESFTTSTTNSSSVVDGGSSLTQFMNGNSINMSDFNNSSLSGQQQMTIIQQQQGKQSSEQTQQLIAGSRTSSIQATMSGSDEQSSEIPAWLEEKLRSQGILKENQRITATAKKTSIRASTTATVGMARSFSSNSGFPLSLSSSNEMNKIITNEGMDSDDKNKITTIITSTGGNLDPSTSPTLDFSNFSSPFRRAPFTFRNFDGPLWTDSITPMGIITEPNRKTWDLSTTFKSKGKVHFSASQSQHAVFESTNGGGFRTAAYQDQRVVLRQSYGASESEDESEDEDDFIITTSKQLGFKVKPNLPLAYKPKLAIQDKPFYEPSEDDTSSVCQSEPEKLATLDSEPINEKFVEHESPKTPEHKKCFKVAQELLTTEKSYVNILHLIDQVFQFRVAQENRVQQMFPPETITQLFCNVKSLYQFHHDHLLPRLEARLERWEDDPRIGDIMKESAPFLKMYSEYVQNFDNSINLINVYKDKNTRFANIINEIQSMEECLNLPIQHHLIGPIQRIPRYRLLLEAYLKRLTEDSSDRKDTEEALNIVSKAAEHANEAMRRIVSFKKLLEAQEQIRGVMDLVSPTRLLIKEGKLFKISARSSEHQERYLFLFSDMVLLCSIRTNYLRSGPQYQLRAKLEVAEMTISEGDDLEVLNTFYIQDENKRIELYTEREDEKRSWMEAMYQARIDLMQRKSSLRLGSTSPSEDDLGVKEPAKIKYDGVSKCMECDVTFTMLKRKHHCHACGIVICAKCCNAKFPMQYANGKMKKVCGPCKIILQGKEAEKRRSANGSGVSSPDEEKIQGVLDVPAEVPAVLNGYLNLRLRGKKEWITRWLALRSDFVLYCYAKDSDDRAMTATPIPGMNIQMVEDLSKNEAVSLPVTEKDRTFRLAHTHGRKCFYFLAPTKEDAHKWVEKLNLASAAAELATPNGSINDSLNNQP